MTAPLKKSLGILRSRMIYDMKPFHCRRLRAFYREYVRAGDLCFDLGAHTGNRTRAFAGLGASVISVEPQEAFMAILKNKFIDHPKIVLVEKAIGASRGTGKLMISSRHPAVSTLSSHWAEIIRDFQPVVNYDRSIEVEVTTLDELIREYGEPRFIKLDVEGFEEQVLQGLSRPVASLSFEFFPGATEMAVRCIDILEDLDKYAYNWSLVETMRYRSERWLKPQEMKKVLQAYTLRKSGDVYARLIEKQRS